MHEQPFTPDSETRGEDIGYLRGLLERQRDIERDFIAHKVDEAFGSVISRLERGDIAGVLPELRKGRKTIVDVLSYYESAYDPFGNAVKELEQQRELSKLRAVVSELCGDKRLQAEFLSTVARIDRELASVADLLISKG